MNYLVEITKELRADDLYVTFDNLTGATLYLAQEAFSPDGYRIYEFYAGSGADLRSGSKAVLRTSEEDGVSNETEYATLALAEAARNALSESHGVTIIDLEQPVGSASSLIIEHRPSLWRYEGSSNELIDSRKNSHGRTDLDRF